MERRCVLNSWSKEEVRAVIRYEWARGVSGTEIHNRLVEVYGPGVMSKQMVRRWCRTFSDGRQQVEDIPRAGRTLTATTDANVRKVDDMIRANRRITIDEVAEELEISHERAQNIIHDHSSIQKSVSMMGAPTIDLDTQGTTHGGQPGTSRALPLQIKCSSQFSGTSKEFCCWTFWRNFKELTILGSLHVDDLQVSGHGADMRYIGKQITLSRNGQINKDLCFENKTVCIL
ncbi:hypothetical protein X975_26773, partial [Stegodyphus mimosarum]